MDTIKAIRERHSVRQYLDKTIEIEKRNVLDGNIVLIDDIVDSKWTLTVCGRLLRKIGAEKVFPFCLADSSEVLGD